jgi:mannonate dehydratase
MKIDKAEVIVTSPDRNFVTLKLTTDEGVTGLGDASSPSSPTSASTSCRC